MGRTQLSFVGLALLGVVVHASPSSKLAQELDSSTPDKDVEWEFWTTADLTTSFARAFMPFAHKLKESTNFVPHYFIWDGEVWGCTNQGSCYTQCVGGGKYCSPDPDGATDAGVSGANVVLENLRQMCVWEQMDFKSDGGEKWWRYVAEMKDVFERVIPSNESVSVQVDFFESYSKEIHINLGLNYAMTEACMKMVDDDHHKLRSELQARKFRPFVQNANLPSVVVGGQEIREVRSRDTSVVLQALCSAINNPGSFCTCVLGTDDDVEQLCGNTESIPPTNAPSNEGSSEAPTDEGATGEASTWTIALGGGGLLCVLPCLAGACMRGR
jgi:hypothetical protein